MAEQDRLIGHAGRMNEDEIPEIPLVCLIDDLVRILRTSRRTIERLRRHGAFPIPELPSIDKRPRWSRSDVRRFLEQTSRPTHRRR